MENHNERKFIPLIRKRKIRESFPIYLSGKLGINFKDDSEFEENYKDLLATLYGAKKKPELGNISTFINNTNLNKPLEEYEDINILRIITNEVTVPKMDGSRGSALYKVPFKLSQKPSSTWKQLFINLWNRPPRFTSMHRPGIVNVIGDKIILDGTTIEEVRSYHRETLLLCIEEANKKEKRSLKVKMK